MLFNSAVFLFGFLPATLTLYFLLGTLRSPRPALFLLVVASLFFYGWWSPKFLWVLLASISVNAFLGYQLIHGAAAPRFRRAILVLGIVFNLSLLGWFKYAVFVATTMNELLGADWHPAAVALPLGISFFTFQKIAFLVDAHRRLVPRFSLLHYCLFVTFFPQLIAGPIVHHAEFTPQLDRPGVTRVDTFNLAMGFSIFCIGLFMKTVLADVSATYANPVFDAAAAGKAPEPAQAWIAALAYSFQLYYDFAGYSAMAIGLARMFNVILPLNFYSPYKASNIIEFWRRWHITLSRFLRDYLYYSLGGNRRGRARRYVNLLLTMVLGGLWHGAAWTFVLWGAAHGVMLVVNHAWHALLRRMGVDTRHGSLVGQLIGIPITFVAVVTAWVPFRSTTFDGMRAMLEAMYGRPGPIVQSFKALFRAEYPRIMAGGLTSPVVWLACIAALTFFAPSLYDLFRRHGPALVEPGAVRHLRPGWLRVEWRMSVAWALFMGLLLAASLSQFGQLSPFLYFQF